MTIIITIACALIWTCEPWKIQKSHKILQKTHLLFWNHVLICVSVRLSASDNSSLLLTLRYLSALNSSSSRSSCLDEYACLGLRSTPGFRGLLPIGLGPERMQQLWPCIIVDYLAPMLPCDLIQPGNTAKWNSISQEVSSLAYLHLSYISIKSLPFFIRFFLFLLAPCPN